MQRRKPALPGTQALYAPPKAHVAIGLVHVAFGVISALGLVVFVFQPFVPAGYWMLTVFLGTVAALRLFGGVSLADGKRRGAMLALTADVLQLGALLVTVRTATFGGLLQNVALIAAVLWVMPHLELQREPAASRANR